MTGIGILLSPPIAFLFFLAAAFGLYALGRGMAPRLTKAGGKLSTYACGENIPGVKVQFGYRLFFYIALFFTMMHVAALVIATVPSGKIVFFALFYLVMIALAVTALVTRS
jgi:NADH-quinone oxidoreductase subunit A